MDDDYSTPAGYQLITPYFTVVSADRLIEFLGAAFDASVIKESRYRDNCIQLARQRIGNSIIMQNESSSDYPAYVFQMHVYVDDADGAYQLALELGQCH
jgi:uncharacterized glyoxalase superfamily protein PhnB